ncbi:MAG: hypothetical protein R2875_12280 [Desulfobacterales bacterium]
MPDFRDFSVFRQKDILSYGILHQTPTPFACPFADGKAPMARLISVAEKLLIQKVRIMIVVMVVIMMIVWCFYINFFCHCSIPF